jgi:hypothetical protein
MSPVNAGWDKQIAGVYVNNLPEDVGTLAIQALSGICLFLERVKIAHKVLNSISVSIYRPEEL